MESLTRRQAQQRLMTVQAQLYVLGEEAKSLASYLANSAKEDQEMIQRQKEMQDEAERAAAKQPAPVEEVPQTNEGSDVRAGA